MSRSRTSFYVEFKNSKFETFPRLMLDGSTLDFPTMKAAREYAKTLRARPFNNLDTRITRVTVIYGRTRKAKR